MDRRGHAGTQFKQSSTVLRFVLWDFQTDMSQRLRVIHSFRRARAWNDSESSDSSSSSSASESDSQPQTPEYLDLGNMGGGHSYDAPLHLSARSSRASEDDFEESSGLDDILSDSRSFLSPSSDSESDGDGLSLGDFHPFDSFTSARLFLLRERFKISREVYEELVEILTDPRFRCEDVPRSWHLLKNLRKRVPVPATVEVHVPGFTAAGVFVDMLEPVRRFLSNPLAVRNAHFVPRYGICVSMYAN